MTRISHVILQGSLPHSMQKNFSVFIDWKKGIIKNWPYKVEMDLDWNLKDVILTYKDKQGNTFLQVHPQKFRFHYDITNKGIIKNWKLKKRDFTSIIRWCSYQNAS